MTSAHTRNVAILFALLGVGLSMGVPFILGSHALFAGLRTIPVELFLVLAASAAVSALAKAGKLQLMQTTLGLRVPFMRTFAITLVTDFAFLVSPLGAAGTGSISACCSAPGRRGQSPPRLSALTRHST